MSRIDYDELYDYIRTVLANGYSINKIYLHWTAGTYTNPSPNYHLNFDDEGDMYLTEKSFGEFDRHTYGRNSNALALAFDAMAGATDGDFGDYPVTDEQIEAMAKALAVIADALGWSTDMITINNVMTHAEAANNMDGWWAHEPYGVGHGSERWDLLMLKQGEEWWTGGDIMRGKTIYYMIQMGG